MFKIVTTSDYLRRLRKFLQNHPGLRERFAQIVDAFIADPSNPCLKYHPRSGKLQGLKGVSITASKRLVLTVLISDQKIILLDIRSHD